MPLPSCFFSELPFAYVNNYDLISLFTSDSPRQINTKSFDPFAIIDEKYNSDLNVIHSCIHSGYLNVPKSDYVFLDSLSSINNNSTKTTTLLSMNIRSIPTNIQSFIDLILANSCVRFDVIGFTETRLDYDLISVYQLPGYNMFTKCRNRNGGGVAVYITSNFYCTMLNEFSFIEPSIECLGVECIVADKTIFIYMYIQATQWQC